MPPLATVVIATKDRREALRTALASAVAQEGEVEVLVLDDGSTDGTAEMVAADFPQARVARFETSAGLVVRRNEAARLATGEVLVSIDDDAVFTTPRVVAQTIADFDRPQIGAVAIPYVDVLRAPDEHQRAPDPDACWVTATFRGTAYAVRRELFLRLGGFREVIFQQGEEADFTLRLLDAGFAVRLGRADPIHHFESPQRDMARMARYGRRNEILLCATRYPAPWHVLAAAGYAVRGLRHTDGLTLLRPTLAGVADGVRTAWRRRAERVPVARGTFALERRLRRQGAVRYDALASESPGMWTNVREDSTGLP